MSSFVHLHNHSDYSLLDGAASIKRYMEKAKSLNMDALALTDHGNMFGAIQFYKACRENGIKPIVGCEFYIAPESRFNKTPTGEENYFHLILLAMNDKGYHNLMKLNSIAWSEGYYYKPRIDKESLKEYSDNLICLSACVAGELSRLILGSKRYGDNFRAPSVARAREAALWYKELFGDRYYIEIQNHGIPEERIAREALIKIAKELEIPIVATNDIHYIERDDSNAHDTLLCIGTGKKKNDENRLRYKEGEYYFRSEEEMRELFKEWPEAIDNTRIVADRCNLEINFPGPILPKCEIPKEYSSDGEYLTALSYEGLKKRYPNAEGEELEKLKSRLQHELDVISRMGFPSYFLIVRDYIHWAKTHGVPVGPGRGSGAGSLVAYTTEITDVDPIKYNLLFERFLNEERVSLPDFDVDFCFEGRSEVIKYVTNHYGKDSVGQISTFGTLKAKQVVKDVARVLDIPLDETNKITNLIPDVIPDIKHWKLQDAIDREPKLQEYEKKGPIYHELFETAKRLEGLSRHSSLHAAGVVIGRERLDTYVPLCTDYKTGALATQYTMTELEECGLVKMDFLGLKTLTLIKHTIELIKKKRPDFDINRISESDEATFKMLQNGDTALVFQFESQGMQKHLKRLKPSSIEELVAMNALYRPGPMQFIDQYIDSKWGRIPITYPDPSLEEILKPTYGVIVYQEQVMQVAQIIAGYSLGAADNLRRIMSKKKAEQLSAELVKFIDGAEKKGHSKKHAEEIFEHLKPFAGYGFNKSHAVAYSIIAYQTAYLKANYLREFLAANLTNEMNSPDKFREYLQLAPKYSIKIVPPDVNTSDVYFSVDGNNIVYGLAAIKNVGEQAVEKIIKEREQNGKYKSFMDFISRQEENVLNKRILESLISAGSFDSIESDRAKLLFNVDDALKFDKDSKNILQFGQMSLFGDDAPSVSEYQLKPAPNEKSKIDILKDEKDMLGFFISGHPLDEYKSAIEESVRISLENLERVPLNYPTQFIALVTSKKVTITKAKKEKMGIYRLQSKEGEVEAVAFPKAFEKMGDMVEEEGIYGFEGTFARRDDGTISFKIENAVSPYDLRPISVGKVMIILSENAKRDDLGELRSILMSYPGSVPVYMRFSESPRETLKINSTLFTNFSKEFRAQIEDLPIVEDIIIG